MAREIPEVVRAAAGLAATVLDEARKLPEILPGLPVRVVGLAMQTAMKIQQGYSGLVARGDEVFTGIRGEQEPGLATFDDEVEAQTGGYRESAFDRADVTFADNEVAGVPDREADATVAAVEELSDEISAAQETLEAVAAEAPGSAEVLDELAIDEQLETAPAAAPDVVTGGEAAVDEALGSQPVAEAPARETPAAEVPATDEGGTTVAATTTVRTAPVEGYDDWSIAQLRGRLRGYVEVTVRDLLEYEQATRARDPYARMLRNRLERLQSESA